MLSKVIVSKSALLANLRAYRRAIGGVKILSVVKSEAYGHGLLGVAKVIEPATHWLGTASGQEALALRKAGIKKPILVLSFYDPQEITELVKRKISLVVYDAAQARLINQVARRLRVRAAIHLKIDTGTSRVGVRPESAAELINHLVRLEHVKIEGVFSHFAASEENQALTAKQNQIFEQILTALHKRKIYPLAHIACTAAGIVSTQSRHDLVRLGLGLYGLWPSDKSRRKAKFKLKPALQWQTEIIQVKTLPQNTNIGYGLTYKTKQSMKLAVLPVGYFDGYDRKLSNNSDVLIGGRRCPVRGRICMNLMMVDVTHVKSAKIGDGAVLIGRQGREEITADELAQKIGTINYEVVARINPLIPRQYAK